MNEFLNLAMSGLVPGAIYSIMASGIVLTYQTSGIFNFAHGAVAFVTAPPIALNVQVGLLLGDQAAPRLPMDRVIAWELELYGSHGMAAHEYPAMLELIAAGVLRPEQLVGRVVRLDEAPDALAAMGGPVGSTGMTIVVP